MKKLDTELGNFAAVLHISPIDAAMRLYEASDGKPCFIEFNNKEYKGQQSLLLSITFFDSIRNKVSHRRERWWSPLQEKQISYNYSTISGTANAWVYFKAPANFVLSVSNNATDGQYEASPSNDDEITSLVLTPKGEKLSIDFKISINVPNALNVWYNVMLYLAYLGVLWGLVLVGNILCGSIQDKMIETFNNCSYAIIASLIATRGWLMSEEQVMKNLGSILEAAGADYDKVVKTTCFLAEMGDFGAFNEVYAKYFTEKPARSCVAVKTLPKNVLCEVEVIAYLG